MEKELEHVIDEWWRNERPGHTGYSPKLFDLKDLINRWFIENPAPGADAYYVEPDNNVDFVEDFIDKYCSALDDDAKNEACSDLEGEFYAILENAVIKGCE